MPLAYFFVLHTSMPCSLEANSRYSPAMFYTHNPNSKISNLDVDVLHPCKKHLYIPSDVHSKSFSFLKVLVSNELNLSVPRTGSSSIILKGVGFKFS
jgi:hypothetical protein